MYPVLPIKHMNLSAQHETSCGAILCVETFQRVSGKSKKRSDMLSEIEQNYRLLRSLKILLNLFDEFSFSVIMRHSGFKYCNPVIKIRF